MPLIIDQNGIVSEVEAAIAAAQAVAETPTDFSRATIAGLVRGITSEVETRTIVVSDAQSAPRVLQFGSTTSLSVDHYGPVAIYDDAGSMVTGEEVRSGRRVTITFVVAVSGTIHLL